MRVVVSQHYNGYNGFKGIHKPACRWRCICFNFGKFKLVLQKIFFSMLQMALKSVQLALDVNCEGCLFDQQITN